MFHVPRKITRHHASCIILCNHQHPTWMILESSCSLQPQSKVRGLSVDPENIWYPGLRRICCIRLSPAMCVEDPESWPFLATGPVQQLGRPIIWPKGRESTVQTIWQ